MYSRDQLRIFTEPQQGATYDDLLAVTRRAEQLGFGAFFRSDHYLAMGDVLEAGVTMCSRCEHCVDGCACRRRATIVRRTRRRLGRAGADRSGALTATGSRRPDCRHCYAAG